MIREFSNLQVYCVRQFNKNCGILILLILFQLPGNVFSISKNSNNQIFIDPTVILDTLLAPITDKNIRKKAESAFENALQTINPVNIEFTRFTPVLFYYRDEKVAPLFKKIALDTNVHLYFRILAVYCLGECGNKDDIKSLEHLMSNTNPLFREYISNAIGKLVNTEDLKMIQRLLVKEKNFYVKKTLESVEKCCRSKGKIAVNMTLDKASTVKKILFYPCENPPPDTLAALLFNPDTLKITIARSFFPPHLQYKNNNKLYQLIEYPQMSFGLKDAWGIHVGDDSGWLFPGLPVHSIIDGVVVRVQHELSWGNLVAIESRLCDDTPVTVYYGHLSSCIYVKPGDRVSAGERIGEVALSFTVDNGGYLSHLHLGIEKAKHSDAQIKGWADSMDRWINPVEFIRNYSVQCLEK